MKRFHTIVAAMALDARDATTLEHIAHIARSAESKTVYLVHVARTFDLPTSGIETMPGVVAPLDELIETKLKRLRDAYRAQFPEATRIECVEREGAFVAELIRLAAQKDADLLCLGRKVPGDHDLMSESAATVLRKAPCATFIPTVNSAPAYHRILVPVDFSEHSREAVEMAGEIATANSAATLTILYVYSVPTGFHKTGQSYEEFAQKMKALAEEHWTKFAPHAHLENMPHAVPFELGDNVPRKIVEVADELNADLVVMGSHGRTAPAAALLGHVTDVVAGRITRPLLCVKRKGEVVNFLHALLQLIDIEGSG